MSPRAHYFMSVVLALGGTSLFVFPPEGSLLRLLGGIVIGFAVAMARWAGERIERERRKDEYLRMLRQSQERQREFERVVGPRRAAPWN